MGKKRRRENSEERIRRKIQKLEGKLQKRRVRVIYSSDDEPERPRGPTPDVARPGSPTDAEVWAFSPTPSPPPEPVPPPDEPSPAAPPAPPPPPPSPPPGPSSAPEPQLPTPCASAEETPQADLDDEVLRLLGEAPESETVFGKAVHKDIAARWTEIIKKGLTKEAKDKIFKDYYVPENCELLLPPKLNPEAKAALTESFIKRDASLELRQKHLTVAVSALAHTMDNIISNRDLYNAVGQRVLQPISDACRIMCDMHHYETMTRKKFVYSSINSELKDALTNSKTDKFLFGENMSDRLKAAKTVQRSGEALKVTQARANPRYAAPASSFNYRNRENFKTLPQLRRPNAGRFQQAPTRQQPAYPRGQTAPARPSPYAPPARPPPPPPAPQRRNTRR
ncbi:uncharacterized protein LOC119691882 [Plutella xylostella]|uniref:uncharacterized protein LOC119691882 n=1 Tax=Plutella xylostella TaxID=51655 RepID=UPI0020329785|nr:uncharacterized protein LOC119691882 [Plutella xylostella]